METITFSKALEKLNCSRKTILNLIEEKSLYAIKDGKSWKISKQSLDKNKDAQNDKTDEINNNILEESDELKDSYCDNILKNIDKFRGELQDE